MKSAIAYLRASTQDQHITIEAQEKAIRAYAEIHGINLVDVIIDAGVSAGVPLAKRDGGSKLALFIKRKSVDLVIATKLDRLFRSAGDCLVSTDEWAKKSVGLVLLDCGGQQLDTQSPMGRLFLTMMSAVAECEKAMIGERTKTALAHKKAKGERISKDAPIGFRFEDGMLVEDAHEQSVLAKARKMKSLGWTYNKIAKALNEKGVPARGKAWHGKTLAAAC